jgi:hypothetical protein
MAINLLQVIFITFFLYNPINLQQKEMQQKTQARIISMKLFGPEEKWATGAKESYTDFPSRQLEAGPRKNHG